VATEDLPTEVRGRWVSADGRSLKIEDYYLDEPGGEVAPKAATAAWTSKSGESVRAHITTFDGQVVLGEEYLGGELLRRSQSPRRFYRLRINGDELIVDMMRLDLLVERAQKGNPRCQGSCGTNSPHRTPQLLGGAARSQPQAG
jgi:hypothetical protein